jgi:hypothetical protein
MNVDPGILTIFEAFFPESSVNSRSVSFDMDRQNAVWLKQ